MVKKILSYRNFNNLTEDKSTFGGQFRQPFTLRAKGLDQIGCIIQIRPSPFEKRAVRKEDSARAKRVPIWLLFAALLILTAKVNKVNAEVVIGDQIDIYIGSNMQAEQSAAYDSVNERFLVVWDDRESVKASIYGQLINTDGSLYGGRIAICEAMDNQYAYGPEVVFDPVNQRFLVVWGDNHIRLPEMVWVYESYAQFVNSDGSLSGGNFGISPDPVQVGNTYPTAITFDSLLNRFFVLMYLKGNIIGQFVNTDSSLIGDYFLITNFISGYGVASISLGYDSNNNRFLVAYGNGDDGDIYGRLLNADGTFYSAEFIISDTGEPGGGNYIVSIPFDPFNNRFLAVFSRTWWMHMVQGQLINAGGTLYGGVTTIIDYGDGGSSIFDSFDNKFLVVGNSSDGSIGQLLNPDGSFFGSSFTIEPLHMPYAPIVGGNSLETGSLVIWSVDLGYGTDRDIVGRLMKYINSAPILNPIGDKEVNSGELLTFEVSGYDLEEDPLSITSPNLPSGATLVDHGDGTATFSWTPKYYSKKIVNPPILPLDISPLVPDFPKGIKCAVTFQISDGKLTDAETIVITVKSKRGLF